MIDLNLGDTDDLIAESLKQGLLRNECAYVLATAKWETAHTMEPVREAYWLSESWRRTNLRYYPWYGRGYVQLTWEDNYKRAQKELELGTLLTDNPDAAMDPRYACQIIVMGMKAGWFTGKKLSDYIDLQRSDFKNARRIVNGTDKAQEIADIAKEYDAVLTDIGYGIVEEEPTTPPPPSPMPPPPGSGDIDHLLSAIASLTDRIEQLEDAMDSRCAPERTDG